MYLYRDIWVCMILLCNCINYDILPIFNNMTFLPFYSLKYFNLKMLHTLILLKMESSFPLAISLN